MQKLWKIPVLLLLVLSLCLSVGAADLEQEIIRGCEEEKWTKLREYEISEEEFEKLFFQLRNDGKLPWYIDYSYTYYSDDDGTMTSFKPDVLDPEVYDRVAYELAVAEILHDVILPDMTQTQMALAVHDYLITHCVYDESWEKNTGYDLLINGTTVCAGYADLYMDILNRLGIPCVSVESDPMDHVWNLVFLEGEWYHVDVTWDDPTPDVHGQVLHTYFLLTDEQIRSGDDPHYDWVTDIVCDSQRYTDAFWRDIDSQIVYLNADLCILRKPNDKLVGYLYTYQESTGKQKLLMSDKTQYINIGHGEYSYWHTGVSLWNGRLYFNDLTRVCSVDLQGKDRRVEYTHVIKNEKKYISGCFVEKDMLYISLSDHEHEDVKAIEVALSPSGYHQHSYQTRHVEAGCETPECTLHYCSCGVEMYQRIGPADGHLLNQTSVEGNTLQLGCQVCSNLYEVLLPEAVFFRWLPEVLQAQFS